MTDPLDRIEADQGLRIKGWDGFGAQPVTDEAIAAARTFLRGLSAVPMLNGGVQIEIHDSTCDFEIEFGPDGKRTGLLLSSE